MADTQPIRRLEGDWGEIVLVCRKCSKKLGGGFGPERDQRLAKALRRQLGCKGKLQPARRNGPGIAVLETGCLGLCPKGAVVAIRPGGRAQPLLVRRGDDPEAVALALGFEAPGA